MSLAPGQKLAHYEIVEPIGKGGMGEVFRARDTKLGRDVAIKVLPEEFARDTDRLARFKREAKVLASLNHPNIAAIHGLDEAEGMHFLVLELVPGETLADRIARGAMPIDEAIAVATQISEGLEEAHEQGIVHRDLKPANIKLTEDDKVKILDFGLAKAFGEEATAADDSMSPTLTQDATRAGVILGTAAYMSPEQAKGKRVDRRTDVFAFGAVLYEMLTGKKAFRGESVSEVLAAVMKDEPDWGPLPRGPVGKVVHRCLAKAVNLRYQHVGDARIELNEQSPVVEPSKRDPRVSAFVGLVVGVVTGAAMWAFLSPAPAVPRPISRWSVPIPAGSMISRGVTGSTSSPSVAISPDGRHLAYVLAHGETTQLYLRATDSLDAEPVDRGEGASNPFFSADSQSLAFGTREGHLLKVSVRGGAPVAVSSLVGLLRGASWGSDGNILFNFGTSDELQRVHSEGGEPELVVAARRDLGEKAYRFPEFLPGNEAAVATLVMDHIDSYDEASIVSISLTTGEVRTIVEGGSRPQYSTSGHLVYARAGNLFAVPFDASALEATGTPVRVLEGVASYPANGSTEFALSRDGTLLYAPGVPMEFDRRAVWVDRTGTATALAQETHAFFGPKVSPDGRFVALGVNSANMSLWVYEVARGSLTRIVSGSNNFGHVWTPDGDSITFASDRDGGQSFYSASADGSGSIELLLEGDAWQTPQMWTPDGQTLLFESLNPETGFDIGLLSLAGDVSWFLQTSADERGAAVSPDGEWVAFESNDSGRVQIYVCPFPAGEPRRQVSIEGGTQPRWHPEGGELFYRDGYKVMSVTTRTEGGLTLGQPKLLFESNSYVASEWSYDVAADGERFVMIDTSESAKPPTELVIVQNWAEELKRLVPTDN